MSLSRGARIAVLVAAVAGCSSATSPNNHSTGSLTVTVKVTGNVTPNVTVTGPSGFQKSIASTTQLTGLAPGSYTVTASSVAATNSIVGIAYAGTVTGTPAAVTAGGSASASVQYAARSGSGALWVVGGGNLSNEIQNAAIEYVTSQLQSSSNSLSPAMTFDLPVTSGYNIDANAVAIDAQGNLWVVDDNQNLVVEYPLPTLGLSTSAPTTANLTMQPAPAVFIRLPDSSYTDGLAFDAKGNLWVINQFPSTVVEFTPDQLKATGSPTPAVTITVKTQTQVNGIQPAYPLSIAFDASGDLWVVCSAFGTIVEFTPSQLASSGTPTPAVTLNPHIQFPYYPAFDKAGNLWLAVSGYLNVVDSSNGTPIDSTYVPGTIAQLPASTLTASGSPSPALTLTVPAGMYGADPTAIAFDDSGDLWYTDVATATIGEFTAAQLAAGGHPSPALTILNARLSGVGQLFYGTGLAFNPHSSALPLH